ncbi:MAG: acetyl-CoA carboxylase carboxyltransferase subunit alpha [Chitinivibrionia bacterium]|nr:acetyl-CoA carboxylase carboxyltransferase subunit alpha [Chitinivibrionia bacterium]
MKEKEKTAVKSKPAQAKTKTATQAKTEAKAKKSNTSSWETTLMARNQNRPYFKDYAAGMFTDFIELHGDRRFSDDKAISGGFAKLGGLPVMLIGHNKGGVDVTAKAEHRFGLPLPDGYRKAQRLMELAQKFNTPVITLIDTSGAYPGIEGEERGQAEAIARNLVVMAQLKVPVVVVVVGEGGSGGALGIGVGDTVFMLENAVYSVISPEGCAGILWRDGTKAELAANALKITANDLIKFGIIDKIIDEPEGGAHKDHAKTFENVREVILEELQRLQKLSPEKRVENRIEKFAKMGVFTE